MVTYFKGSGIIAGALAAYTVTVMWGATLVARLLIAFVFPFKQPRKAMVVMGVSCTIFYILLVQARSQGAAIVLLFAFAFAMAGMNTAVASAGRMTGVTSMGIMLPAAASGAILMPWVIGVVAESAGLAAEYDDQHRSLRGSGHLCDPGCTFAGRIKIRSAAVSALYGGGYLIQLHFVADKLKIELYQLIQSLRPDTVESVYQRVSVYQTDTETK